MKKSDKFTKEQLLTENEQLRTEISRLKNIASEGQKGERWDSFMNSTTEGYAIMDSNLNMLETNNAGAAMFGLTRDDIVGKNVCDVSPDAKSSGRYEMYINVIKTGLPVSVEESIAHPVLGNVYMNMKAFKVGDGVGVIVTNLTEQKKAEENLIKQADLLDQVHNAVITIDFENIILSWNKYAEELYQWTDKEAIGKSIVELLSPVELKEVVNKNFESLNREGHWEGDFDVKRKDGTTIPAHIINTYLKDSGGNNIGFIGVSYDITEQRKTEDELNKHATNFNDLLNDSRTLLYKFNLKTKTFDYLGKVMEAFVGISAEDYIKGGIELAVSILHPDDRDRLDEHLKHLLSGSGTLEDNVQNTIEYRFKNAKTGQYRWFSDNRSVVFDEKGEPTATVGSLIDITERKKTEEALKENEEYLNTIYKNSEIGVFVVRISKEGKYIYEGINPAHEKLVGITNDFIKGKTPDDLKEIYDKETVKFINNLYYECVKKKTTIELEHEVTVGEAKGWWITRLSPVIDENGNVIKLIGSGIKITRRKKAEDKLKQQEAALKQAQRIAQIGSWEMDVITKKITWSEQLYRIMEVDMDEQITFELYYSRVHPEDLAYVQEVGARVYKKNEAHIADYRLLLPSGTIKFVSTRGHQTLDDNGNVIRLSGIVQDITQRHKEEEALLKSESRLASSQEIAQIGTWNLDIVNDVLEWTDQNYKIFGVKLGTPMNLDRFFKIVHPDDLDYVAEKWTAGINGEEYDIEHRLLIKGKVKWVREKADVTFDENGKAISAVGITQDITEKKIAESKLKESEEMLLKNSKKHSAMIENIGDVIAIVGADGATKYQSPNVEKWFGWKPEELLGNRWDLIHPEDVELVQQEFAKVLESEKIIPVEYRFKCKDGNYRWIEVRANNRINDPTIGGVLLNYHDITERKKVELSLNSTKDLLERTGSVAKVGGWELDLVLNEMIFTKEARLINDLDPGEEISLEEALNMIHPDDQEAFRAAMEKSLIDGKPWDRELRMTTTKGRDIWVRTQANIEMEKGKAIKMYGTFQDITAKKQIENDLQESKERYDLAMQASQDGVFDWNLITNDIYYSPSWKRIIGYEDNELPNDFSIWENLTEPEDVEKSWKMQQELINKQRDRFEIEFKMKHKDGHWVNILSRAEAVFDETDKAIRIVGTHTDISEHKKAEQEIIKAKEKVEESEQRYNNFITQIKDGVYRFEFKKPMPINLPTEKQVDFIYKNAIIAECNPAFMKMYGIEKEKDIIGKTQEALHGGTDNEQNRESLRNFVKENYYVENVLTKEFDQEGNNKYFSNNAIGIIEDDKLIRMWGTQTDITNLFQMAQDLKKRNKEIEALNVDYESQNVALKEAKEKAEESDRLKSAFLANMSHEIRTPMNGILGFLGLLKEPDLTDDKKNRYIKIVNTGGERLLTTINDIIEISKIESKDIMIEKEKIGIRDLLSHFYDFFLPQTTSKQLDFNIVGADKLENIVVYSDKNKLDSILTNLLKNAIKFTKTGKIEFGCTVNKNELKFFVKDTGIGINTDRIDAVFERFVQADINLTKGYEGSGLGLSISKSYCEMLGGKIWVKSEIKKGSTFYFTIPIDNGMKKSVPEVDFAKKHKGTKTPVETDKKLKILITEDDEVSSIYLETLLEDINCEILKSKTGAEAVYQIKNHPDIDIILMDIKLPDMNGYDATKEIRRFNNEVKIIAQTAFAFSGDEANALKAGCNDYITKPIKKDVLFNVIEKYWKK